MNRSPCLRSRGPFQATTMSASIISSTPLYLQAKDLEELVVARFERYKLIEEKEPMAEEYLVDDAEYVVVAYGASARIAKAAVRQAREEGVKVGLIRPSRSGPSEKDPSEGSGSHKGFSLCGDEHGPDGG